MMRQGFLILVGLALLSACSMRVPDFLGREGGGGVTYGLREEEPDTPDPVALPLRTAQADRALDGTILRAEGVSPTQGYYGAQLKPANETRSDANGVVVLDFVAIPPSGPQNIGPERTRVMRAALFFSDGELRKIKSFQIKGATNAMTIVAPRPPVAPPVLATDIPGLEPEPDDIQQAPLTP